MVEDGNEEIAVQLVVAEGILSTAEARTLSSEAAQAGQSLLERLRGEGRISGATFASLHAEMIRQALEEMGQQSTLRRASDAGETDQAKTWAARDRVDSEAFPVPGWDRYAPIRLLGQGGMGRVFLAHDLQLKRDVAIKFVRGDDPELAERIIAEARAQARVKDDRVCQVYEVGEVRGRVYIAMQHIDGRPLSELTTELSFEEKAIVMRGAALGVAEAHRVGLIHRDLKPSNIMVERGAGGELRPFVMDFGLARDSATATTMTGTVLGTPHYMAPEQARGEVKQLDRRADVYSLGATLYTLLVGKGPIEGTNPLEVLNRVATDEPARPRAIDPDVPADLEAIAMKCLEKERAARYDSARALADDLGRFLGGEPVAARATAGLGYRLRKRLARHRRLVAGVTVAVVLVAVALGFGLRERWQAERQAERRADLARQFTERVERIEAEALASALSPMHDLRPDHDGLRRVMAELADEVRAGGELAAGPGHYALGRGYLALDDDDRAAAELTAAWESGFHEPRVAYHLALAHGHLYQRELREITRADISKEQRAQRRADIESRHRDPALQYLGARGVSEVASSAYVKALIAFYEERFDGALAQLDIAQGSDARAWSYEVPLLRGEILHARAEVRAEQDSPRAAAADLADGRRVLEVAATIGRSVPGVYRAHAELELTALRREVRGGAAVAEPFARGKAKAEQILTLLPDDAGALTLRARLQRILAEYRGQRGDDVAQLLTGAIDDAKHAIERDPARTEGRLLLASIYKQWGQVRNLRGQDPREQLGQAVQIIDSIVAAQRDAEFYVVLGAIHEVWANYEDRTGQDSLEHRRLAIDAFAQAVRIDERSSVAWLSLGENYSRRASQPRADADRDFLLAREALSRARALDPTNAFTYLYEGAIHSRVAIRKQAQRVDPAPDRAQAIKSYQQGALMSPLRSDFYIALSKEYLDQAQEVRDHGRDPLPDLTEAEAAARRAIEVAPDDGYGYINVGRALLDRATYQQSLGGDPLPAAGGAEAAFRQALKYLPERPSIWWNLADLHILVAGVELDGGRSPQARLRMAEESIDGAQVLDHRKDNAAKRRDKISQLRGQWQAHLHGRGARQL